MVVFVLPRDATIVYTERLLGLPGDRVQMRRGALYINGQMVPRTELAPFVENLGGFTNRVARYRETLPNGRSYEVLDREPNGGLDDTGVFQVPEGHYFMIGNNRDNSNDSRASVGYVPYENLIGKVQVTYFSTGRGRIWEFWKWPQTIRWNRIGRAVK